MYGYAGSYEEAEAELCCHVFYSLDRLDIHSGWLAFYELAYTTLASSCLPDGNDGKY